MHFESRFWRVLVAFALLAAVFACTPIYRDHGYTPSHDDLAQLVIGVTSKEEVLQIAGTPTTKNDDYGEAWYYVSSRFRQEGYRQAEEIQRQVVAISFNEDGTLENVERFALRDGRTVVLSRRVTQTNTGRLTFIDQILRGFGRIDPARILGG